MGRVVCIDVPATSANLGAGFDALALALDLASRIDVEVVAVDREPTVMVEVEGEGSGHLPAGRHNRFVQALYQGLAAGGLVEPAIGLRVRMENRIPVSRGLGSSAAATVAALVAADALLDGGLGEERILELAAAAEGHPDNAAAAILGGLCVVAPVKGRPRAVRIEPPAALLAALFIPDRPLSTAAMRAALPKRVPFADAVHNVAAAATAVAAFSQDRLDLLRVATKDRLHEPYRAAAYPELPAIIEAAVEAGALGACLSGAGSTVIAFSDQPEMAARVAEAMRQRAEQLGLPGRAAVHAARAAGARIIGSTDATGGSADAPGSRSAPRLT